MSQTSVPRGSSLANKQFSKALSAMAVRQPTPMTALTGPMPTHDAAMRKLKQQTTTEMPIVRVEDLSKAAGDVVQLDCAHVIKLRAVMGDANAEGKGATLKYSSKDIVLDMATLPVSAGGKMTQQRTAHSMRQNALAQLKRAIPAFRWQRCLTMLAGARGNQNSTDWVLPLDTDPEFADMMVNAVRAPSFNRHFVVNGTGLDQGGARLATVASTDGLKLSHLDEFAAIWDEMTIKMAPIMIPGDPAAGDDQIKGVMYHDPLAWDSILTDTAAGSNLRKWESEAIQRAKYGELSKHPLFSGAPIMWNGILHRKMQYAVRHGAGAVIKHVTAANRLAGTETDVTIAAGLSTTHEVATSIFMGAQALAVASGGNQSSEETYSLLEKRTNFNRNLELAGEIMGVEDKLRWALPNADGNLEVTDFGVAVIHSVVRKRNV